MFVTRQCTTKENKLVCFYEDVLLHAVMILNSYRWNIPLSINNTLV